MWICRLQFSRTHLPSFGWKTNYSINCQSGKHWNQGNVFRKSQLHGTTIIPVHEMTEIKAMESEPRLLCRQQYTSGCIDYVGFESVVIMRTSSCSSTTEMRGQQTYWCLGESHSCGLTAIVLILNKMDSFSYLISRGEDEQNWLICGVSGMHSVLLSL